MKMRKVVNNVLSVLLSGVLDLGIISYFNAFFRNTGPESSSSFTILAIGMYFIYINKSEETPKWMKAWFTINTVLFGIWAVFDVTRFIINTI
ncbi:MAG: hypothetical protein LBM95_07530 [Lactobacillales bacterium]|nr:hypothetical protein [Lactobacillales bacterium]